MKINNSMQPLVSLEITYWNQKIMFFSSRRKLYIATICVDHIKVSEAQNPTKDYN
jgi:hypothetical protein